MRASSTPARCRRGPDGHLRRAHTHGRVYRKLDVVGVRVVATSAIRDTRNQREFLARASEAAGAPWKSSPDGKKRASSTSGWRASGRSGESGVLIIDIGGGSAEVIAADGGRLVEAFSKPLGAVRLRETFLKDDPPAGRQLHQMHEYIQAKLDAPLRRLGHERLGPRHRHLGHRRAVAARRRADAALQTR